MRKQETKYGKLIGRQGDEYYYLDYTFEDGTFKGAVGSIMRPVTIEEAEDRRENFDDDGERWQMAVDAGATELGKKEWKEMVLDIDGDEAVFDQSYYEYGEDLLNRIDPKREIYELVECRGGGRCFYFDTKWDELFDPALWKEILKFEKEIK